ncbi:hypothetical protein CXB51_035060 [Gossypium anomalum]|uniref:Uncharacterized protein n=1 Tax=Gossypium anomalum TaxID=47600 RepID=A0A8J5Y1Y9_9ROSI|nr:hypothetical protein CXB51_035060 [Gossypium anomalum]
MLVSNPVLCAHVYRFNEFGVDGGPAAKALKPNSMSSQRLSGFSNVSNSLSCYLQIKVLVAAAVAFKGVGGILFIFGSTIGAYLLALQQVIVTTILYDFYNYDTEKKEFGLLFSNFSQVSC